MAAAGAQPAAGGSWLALPTPLAHLIFAGRLPWDCSEQPGVQEDPLSASAASSASSGARARDDTPTLGPPPPPRRAASPSAAAGASGRSGRGQGRLRSFPIPPLPPPTGTLLLCGSGDAGFGGRAASSDDVGEEEHGGGPRPRASPRPSCPPCVEPPAHIRNLGPREGLPTLIAEFSHNASFADKVQRLEQRGYTGWRRVRGDGNCYYRSVGFGLLEQLVVASGPRQAAYAAALRDRLSTVHFTDPARAAAHEDLLARVERLRSGGGWDEPSRAAAEMTAFGLLYRSLHSPQNTADLALVRALRQLTASYLALRAHDEEANHGISFHDICVCGGEFESVEDFCNKVVLPDGVEAETLCQQALPAALGVAVRIAFLDRHEKDIQFLDFGLPADADPEEVPAQPLDMPLVHVQLRPGHYDLLYFREEPGPGARAASAPASPSRCRYPTLGAEDPTGECEAVPRPPRRPASARRQKSGLCP